MDHEESEYHVRFLEPPIGQILRGCFWLLQEPRSEVRRRGLQKIELEGGGHLQSKFGGNRVTFSMFIFNKRAENAGLLYLYDPPDLSMEPSEIGQNTTQGLAGCASQDAGRPQTPFPVNSNPIFFGFFATGPALSVQGRVIRLFTAIYVRFYRIFGFFPNLTGISSLKPMSIALARVITATCRCFF